MLISERDNKKAFFIHIPRTGGRCVTNFICNNGYNVSFNNMLEEKFNVSIPHLHYPYCMFLVNFEEIPQFTIVRNPLDRFISAFSIMLKKYTLIKNNKFLLNRNLLFEVINAIILETSDNFLRPQHHFIGPNCKFWKIEDGLGENFINWLEINFNLKLKNKKILLNKEYDKGKIDDFNKIILEKKTIDYIKEYYKFDYKILGY